MIIHPDKQKDIDTTKSFQCLINAFERVTKPTNFVDDTDAKTQVINRTNNNCFKTYIACPKCKSLWNFKKDGHPEYAYNLLMCGLKT